MSDQQRAKALDAYANVLEREKSELEAKCRKLQKEIDKSRGKDEFFHQMADLIMENPPIANVRPLKPTKKKDAKTKESVGLIISDMHADQNIPSHRVQGLEEYNFQAACHRGDNLVQSTIKWMNDNMATHEFDSINVFLIGDLTNGEIHGGTKASTYGNAIKNSAAIGELLGHMFCDLADHYKVNVISVPGNHGRRSHKKDYRGPHENWDYLCALWAKQKCRSYIDAGRMSFEIPDSYTAVVKIRGKNFVLNHGDDVRGSMGLPWYGIERRTRRLVSLGAVTGDMPNYFVYGHFHTFTTQQHTTGEAVINGSWPATDEYAIEQLGAYSEPNQVLFGIHENHGMTWRMPVYHRSKDWKTSEKKQPSYGIII